MCVCVSLRVPDVLHWVQRLRTNNQVRPGQEMMRTACCAACCLLRAACCVLRAACCWHYLIRQTTLLRIGCIRMIYFYWARSRPHAHTPPMDDKECQCHAVAARAMPMPVLRPWQATQIGQLRRWCCCCCCCCTCRYHCEGPLRAELNSDLLNAVCIVHGMDA